MKNSSVILIPLALAIVLSVFLFILIENSKVPETPDGCIEDKNFPGVSKEISILKKGENGYFPYKLFHSDLTRYWYGKKLKAAKETSFLDISDKDIEIYRFSWLRSFHNSIIIRIEKQEDKTKLFLTELDRVGIDEPEKILRQSETSIDNRDSCNFTKLLNNTKYWKIPPKLNDSGRDGSNWVVEGVKENRYHIVDRWSPKEGKYREVGLFMLKLSGFDLDKNKDDLY